MDNNPSISKDKLKSRLEKIKEQRQLSTLSESFSSSSTSTTLSSLINAKQMQTDASPKTIINPPLTREELKNAFRQASNNHSIHPNASNKEKLGLFVQQANECFQNYEKEIGELRHKLTMLSSFQNKLSISFSSSTISLFFLPTNEELFNIKMRKLTEEEGASSEAIQNEYNKKISELFKENVSLSLMIKKLSSDVVNALQEKIQELGVILKKEKELKEEALNQLKAIDSVFQQNSDMKASLAEKDKVIVSLHSQLTEAKGQLQEHKTDLNSKAKTIQSQIKSLEQKDKKLNEQRTEIDQLKKTGAKQVEIINQKTTEIKEKDEEIQILFNDNIQWEDKYKLQSKEIENFKKWSLWDEDLIEAFKKIEVLNNTLLTKEETINSLTEQIQSLIKTNEEHIAEIESKKKSIKEVKNENDTLNIIKLNYEKEKEKFENFDTIYKENASFKKEISRTIEKYESQIKTDKKNYESELEELTNQHQKEILKINTEKERMIREKENKIQALECKISNTQNEYNDLKGQFDKKNELLTNLKEVYENMVKKLKTQEEKIQLLEKGDNTGNKLERKTDIHNDNMPKPKVYSTFDKFAFTKEIMVDYIFILFLFESSVNIQHLLDNLLRNINTYYQTIFLRQSNPKSILTELLEDVFLIAFDKLLCNKTQIKNKVNSNCNKDFSFMINFEQFNQDTIDEICELLISSNPLTRFKNKKSLEEIEQLFISKYAKSFDFDENLETYLTENIIPSVASRIEKYDKVIFNDAHTLIEISLNNIKDGQIIIDNRERYSYEHFFNEYKHIQLNSNDTSTEANEEEFESLCVNGELKQEEAIDNILYRIKYNEPLEISFNGVFNQNSERVLNKIISSIIIYTPCIEVLCLKNNQIGGHLFKNTILKCISQLKDLRTLDMTNSQIKDDDFKLLCEELKVNNSIETLILSNNNLTSSSGFFLSDVLLVNKSIETLLLDNNQIGEGGLNTLLKVLANKNSLITNLSFGYNNLSQEDFSALGDYLSSDPVVSSLDISGNNVDPQSANRLGVAFRKASSLITLKANFIGLNEVSSAQFLNFLNETNIETIELDKNLFGESGTILLINKIKVCDKLKRMILRMCEISSTYLGLFAQLIQSNTTIEELNLENNLFDDESIISFCRKIDCNQTISVKFSKSNISKKAVEVIKAYSNIKLT